MASKSSVAKKVLHKVFRKRTSQGLYDRPKGKHARKNYKRYRGQGR